MPGQSSGVKMDGRPKRVALMGAVIGPGEVDPASQKNPGQENGRGQIYVSDSHKIEHLFEGGNKCINV